MSVLKVQNALKIVLFLGSFLCYLFAISDTKFRCLGLQNRGFRNEGIAQIVFSWKSFLKTSGIVFVLGDALRSVFLTFFTP